MDSTFPYGVKMVTIRNHIISIVHPRGAFIFFPNWGNILIFVFDITCISLVSAISNGYHLKPEKSLLSLFVSWTGALTSHKNKIHIKFLYFVFWHSLVMVWLGRYGMVTIRNRIISLVHLVSWIFYLACCKSSIIKEAAFQLKRSNVVEDGLAILEDRWFLGWMRCKTPVQSVKGNWTIF